MFYPGLFENKSPYSSSLSPNHIKSEILLASTDVCSSLLDKKKMVANLSTTSTMASTLPFRNAHFSPSSSHYQSQSGPSPDLASSPYTSSSANANLSSNGLASTSLSRQSFLEASAPYSIGSLSSYQPYSTQYLGNSVMNSALKTPNGNTYQSQNSYYSPSTQPYPSLYPETFISDYIARNHIDTNKSTYSATSDNSSFHEHLKRLQESFQSTSGKFTDSTNSASSTTTIPLKSEPLNSSGSVLGNSDDKSTLVRVHDSSSAKASHAHGPLDRDNTNMVCDRGDLLGGSAFPQAWKASPSCQPQSANNNDTHVATDSSKQQLRDTQSTTTNTKCSSRHAKVQPRAPLVLPSEHSARIAEKSKKCRKSHDSNSSVSLTKNKGNKDASRSNVLRLKQKQPKQQQSAGKRKRPEEPCDQSSEHSTGHKKRRMKTSKEPPQQQHESCTEQSNGQTSKTDDTSKETVKMSKSKKNKKTCIVENTENTENSEEPPKKATRPPKKSGGSVRRRRSRKSGLDMIRSRKKTKLSSTTKKDGPGKKEVNKKESPTKDLKLESKRLIVNKSLGETLLHRSARNNRLDVVRFCLKSDACEVNARDNAGYTPLHECSSRGNLQVARLLLEHSADVNASATGGIRPLHDAIENNHVEMVRLLLSYGAEPHISTYSGSTPLQLCRSKAMHKFLKGFYSDITTDRPVIDSSTLAWKLRSEPSDLENGFDVLASPPSDEVDCEQIFYARAEPFLPSYKVMHNSDSPFYLLCDVLDAVALSEAEFILKYPQVELSKVTKSDIIKSSLSQVEHRQRHELDGDGELCVIYQGGCIDDILHISSTVIT